MRTESFLVIKNINMLVSLVETVHDICFKVLLWRLYALNFPSVIKNLKSNPTTCDTTFERFNRFFVRLMLTLKLSQTIGNQLPLVTVSRKTWHMCTCPEKTEISWQLTCSDIHFSMKLSKFCNLNSSNSRNPSVVLLTFPVSWFFAA